ncbi:MAG: hypothetical protein U5L04_00850 [Trueperaceae bacterium]|nr:hypothetical protein [Trueperaceae bacterium]
MAVRYLLTGLGNVGRGVLELFAAHQETLASRYGLGARLVGVADSSGAHYFGDKSNDDDKGDADRDDADTHEREKLLAIVRAKRAGRRLRDLDLPGTPLADAQTLVDRAAADVLFEATPTDLTDGQPGLGLVRRALQRNMHAVLASKGPLVLAYPELAALSDLSGDDDAPALRFSGAVGGATPSVNVGRRDLVLADIEQIESTLSSTPNLILDQMRRGVSFDDALAYAQAQGVVEPDPSLDIDGYDAANKLLILVQSVLGYPATLKDVDRQGIGGLTPDDVRCPDDRVLLLVASATKQAGGYHLSVRPRLLEPDHPLANGAPGEMGVVYHTDLYGRITVRCYEEGPTGTAAAMLRDFVGLRPRLVVGSSL